MNAPNDLKFPPLQDPSLFRNQSYVNGEWINADSGTRFDIDNPADGSIIASVPNCGAAETRRAIVAANAALPAWRAMTAKQRAALLRRWFEMMLLNTTSWPMFPVNTLIPCPPLLFIVLLWIE